MIYEYHANLFCIPFYIMFLFFFSFFIGIDLELPVVKEDKAFTHSFSTGDNVEVSEGELINLQGKIIAIDGYMITVMPKHEDLKVGILYKFKNLGSIEVFSELMFIYLL